MKKHLNLTYTRVKGSYSGLWLLVDAKHEAGNTICKNFLEICNLDPDQSWIKVSTFQSGSWEKKELENMISCRPLEMDI